MYVSCVRRSLFPRTPVSFSVPPGVARIAGQRSLIGEGAPPLGCRASADLRKIKRMAEDEWINGAPVSLLVLLAFVFGMLCVLAADLLLDHWPTVFSPRLIL